MADAAHADAPTPSMRNLWRRDGWAIGAGLGVTVVAELAVYLAVRWAGGGHADALLPTLAVMTVLCCLAPAALACGGESMVGRWLRGGIVADGGAIVLLVLWLIGLAGDGPASPTFLEGLKTYIVLAVVTLVGMAAGSIARSPTGRCLAAVLAAVFMLLALTSPFWISAWIGTGGTLAEQQTAAECAVAVNPFYAVTAAGYHARDFTWHEWGTMYRWTRLGEYVSPAPVAWQATVFIYVGLAMVLSIVAGLWRRGAARSSAASADA
ncbi:MAG: hypothetical protein GVY16_11460 [Planctomycetes bacterium]|nr:hypothetical protein [Planctomycetota bacterium]